MSATRQLIPASWGHGSGGGRLQGDPRRKFIDVKRQPDNRQSRPKTDAAWLQYSRDTQAPGLTRVG